VGDHKSTPAGRQAVPFALLFDPRAPALFLLGALLLAVLGNAAYGLLLLWWGDNLWGMLGAFLGALAALVVVVAGLYALVRARRPAPVDLGAEEEAVPRRGLVLFLSPGEGKADEVALRFHEKMLTWVRLIATAETAEKAARLVQSCRERKQQAEMLYLEQPRDAGESYRLVRRALNEARAAGLGPADLYVDLTGGLRPAAVGATLATLEAGCEIEYVVARYDEEGRVERDSARVMQVRARPAEDRPKE
jgi:hypothetical protein